MAPNLSKYVTKNNSIICGGIAVSLWLLMLKKYKKKSRSVSKSPKKKCEEVKYHITERSNSEKVKVHVNREFFQNLLPILRIVIPAWKSSEAAYIIFVAVSLMTRTFCDLVMLRYITGIESAIFTTNKEQFTKRITRLIISLPLFSMTNGLLKLAIGELKIRLRKNISLHLYNEYLQKLTFYRVANLDNRITNADQILTADIEKFSECLTDLYCNITKPILDIALFSYQISMHVGTLPPGILLCYFLVSGLFLTFLRRPIGRLTVTEQKLEGDFRHVNSRILTHSEEIAFYQGNMREKLSLMTSFNNLMKHLRKSLHFRVLIGVVDNIVAKYFALTIGWFTYSIPFLTGSHGLGKMDIGERSTIYYVSGFMILRLAQTVGRLVLAGGDLTRLAGLTVRVTQLRNVLNDINNGTYVRTIIQTDPHGFQDHNGKLVFKNNSIKFDKVPVTTPNGDVLIKQLSFEIHSGMNVLVCGPNGAGKSSIFRILGELWPLPGGELTKPPTGKLFYIPQKPYMVLGSLRDQVTYPHSEAQAKRRGYSDTRLREFLDLVQLDYLLEREGGFDSLADWMDVLSGGEKQRIAMARLFYHSPQFAILDECTSAVAVDVEDSMYTYCRKVGISLLTVSHRKSLWKYHEYVLYLDGRGGYNFGPIDDIEQFGS